MRNRLIAGCAHATLIIESTQRSGSRITARLATDYNRDVLAVPGPITSELSDGPNELIKQGAIPITTSQDILFALGFTPQPVHTPDSTSNRISTYQSPPPSAQSYSAAQSLFEFIPITPEHELVLNVLTHPMHKNKLLLCCPTLTPATLDARLSELELMNKIKIVLGVIYKQ
jgi:predicted Rossmann fold nucleotide-binding protein DprA/Smf involved in DNA uptake